MTRTPFFFFFAVGGLAVEHASWPASPDQDTKAQGQLLPAQKERQRKLGEEACFADNGGDNDEVCLLQNKPRLQKTDSVMGKDTTSSLQKAAEEDWDDKQLHSAGPTSIGERLEISAATVQDFEKRGTVTYYNIAVQPEIGETYIRPHRYNHFLALRRTIQVSFLDPIDNAFKEERRLQNRQTGPPWGFWLQIQEMENQLLDFPRKGLLPGWAHTDATRVSRRDHLNRWLQYVLQYPWCDLAVNRIFVSVGNQRPVEPEDCAQITNAVRVFLSPVPQGEAENEVEEDLPEPNTRNSITNQVSNSVME